MAPIRGCGLQITRRIGSLKALRRKPPSGFLPTFARSLFGHSPSAMPPVISLETGAGSSQEGTYCGGAADRLFKHRSYWEGTSRIRPMPALQEDGYWPARRGLFKYKPNSDSGGAEQGSAISSTREFRAEPERLASPSSRRRPLKLFKCVGIPAATPAPFKYALNSKTPGDLTRAGGEGALQVGTYCARRRGSPLK